MALIFSTDFSGHSDYTNLQDGPGWTKHTLSTTNLYVFSGRAAHPGTGGSSVYLRPEVPASEDQSVAADIYAEDYGTEVGNNGFVVARFDTSALTGYVGGRHDGIWKVGRLNAGAFTFFGTQTTDYYHLASKRCRLEVTTEGSNVRVKLFRDSETSPVAEHLDTSPISGVGRVGIRLFNGNNKIDNFQADTIEAAAASATITGTTSLPSFSGSAQVAPETSITVTTALPAFSGGASTGSASATVTATTSLPSFSGSATGDTSSGVLTLPVMKNNTGTVLANETGATVHVYAVSTGNKVVTKTGQTTNASGVMTVMDALIVGGTQYRVVVVLGSGAEGLDKVTAS